MIVSAALIFSLAVVSSSLLSVHNGSAVELKCRPAEVFIRTHMAPDFASPQLVRRLDWFHDETLVASFQQEQVADSARQWWVAEPVLSFVHPFYALLIQPVLPLHTGTYKCRLETDPLFALDLSTSSTELAVLVVPVAPSSIELKSVADDRAVIAWSHATARAHRPILQYSVRVRNLFDGTQHVISHHMNATSVIVANLTASTEYSMAVRAENAAGASAFGPEKRVVTKGHPPTSPPSIVSAESTSSCIRLELVPPPSGRLTGWRVALNSSSNHIVYNATADPLREEAQWVEVCNLTAFESYSVEVQARNSHGLSPPARRLVQTEAGVPDPPHAPRLQPVVGAPAIIVHWRAPAVTRGVLTSYSIWYRSVEGGNAEKWTKEHISIANRAATHASHRKELRGLDPATEYVVRVSAGTVKGEGRPSDEATTTTDGGAPDTVQLTNTTMECGSNSIRVAWPPYVLRWKGRRRGGEVIYSLALINSTHSLAVNTTSDHTFLSLSFHERYTIYLTTLVHSLVNNSVLLASAPSSRHHFYVQEGCVLHSSLCSDASASCQPLVAASQSSRFALLFVLTSVVIFLIFSSLLAYLMRQRCFDLKAMLRAKKREKSVYIDELSPLVYDSEGMEDVPVELFYGMCEDLGKRGNAKYRSLFEKVNDLTDFDADGGTPSEPGIDSSRDRYANIVATEASRVRILEADDGSDYINANYVDSSDTPHAYIATQAPLPSTFGHFWSMVWQERVNVVVVITNLVEDGRRKCDPYWPSTSATPAQHGNYQVSLVSQTTSTYYVHRILSLRIAKSLPPTERRIHHLHFTDWPDHGVPPSVFPLLDFLHFVADIHSTGPLLVHCSAGVGRSGSFILIDAMRRRLLSHRTLNVAGHLVRMRRQREKVVQTLEQFVFCHEVVRQMARHGITRVPASILPRYVQFLVEDTSYHGKMRLQAQFDDICKCSHEPRCSPVPSKPLVLPGFHRRDEFVVGWWPRESPDLWKTVWEFGCEAVVLLCPEGEDETFWTRVEVNFDDVTVVHDDDGARVTLVSPQEELSVVLLTVSESAMDTSTWTELERIQVSHGCHSSPLLMVSMSGSPSSPPPPPALVLGTLPRKPCSLSACRPWILAALTSLACQLEQQSAVDVVQTLDAFHAIHCGAFPDRHALEYIYERLLTLVELGK